MVSIDNVKFSYKRGQRLFDGLSLELEAGHVYGLLGRNGEGKSTLLKLISGMLSPKSGEIICMGSKPICREPSFLSQLYYIPEEPYSPSRSIQGYTKMISKFYPNFSYSDFDNYIKEFELDPKRKISAMSLGQKKKYVIAFALACNSKMLIMDEPTNGLDIPSKSQFRKIISRIATDEKVIVISTHQVRDLDNIIDSVIIMEKGKIIVNSRVDDVAKRLCFKPLLKGDEPLYEEVNMMSRYGVVKNDGNEYSKVDIEMLFNATIENSRKICEILNSAE